MPNNKPELYNLRDDPLEKNDVADNNPDKMDVFETKILKHMTLVKEMSNKTRTIKRSR